MELIQWRSGDQKLARSDRMQKLGLTPSHFCRRAYKSLAQHVTALQEESKVGVGCVLNDAIPYMKLDQQTKTG